MSFRPNRTAAGVVVAIVMLSPLAIAWAADDGASERTAVEEALHDFQAWVGAGENGAAWRAYLHTADLEEQLSLADAASPQTVREVLARYQRDGEQLQLPPVVAVREAISAWLDAIDVPSAADLPALARAAKDSFQPVTEQRVDEARSGLTASVRRLNAYLESGGANGEAWKTYVHWDSLRANLVEGATPDLAQLSAVYRQLTADEDGLELKIFSNAAASLRTYIDLLALKQSENPEASFASALDEIAAGLERYAAEPTDEDNYAIGQRLGFLESTGQTPRLIEAVRRNHSHPNLEVQVSEAMMVRGFTRDVDRDQHVTDFILGTSISGEASTTGELTLDLVANADQAELQAVLTGTSLSDTVGSNGPVYIYANGTTEFRAVKRLLLNEQGIVARPATSSATTRTHVRSIASKRGGHGGLVQKIAWKRVNQQKSQAEYVAARHAETRLNDQFDDDADELIADANRDYLDKFRLPLVRRGEFPHVLRFRTTDEHLHVTALAANRYQLGAPSAAPEAEGHDLSVRVHESMLNNFAASLLAGRTFTQEDVRTAARDLNNGELPPKMQEKVDEEPWSITFSRGRPVTVLLSDDTIDVTIRGQHYTSGEREFEAMNISVVYKVERNGDQIKLVRQGDLEILPPNFDPATDTLSASDTALRRIIQNRLEDVFEAEIVAEGLQLQGEWEKIGRMPLAVLSAAGGWLSAEWEMPSTERVASLADAERN